MFNHFRFDAEALSVYKREAHAHFEAQCASILAGAFFSRTQWIFDTMLRSAIQSIR